MNKEPNQTDALIGGVLFWLLLPYAIPVLAVALVLLWANIFNPALYVFALLIGLPLAGLLLRDRWRDRSAPDAPEQACAADREEDDSEGGYIVTITVKIKE